MTGPDRCDVRPWVKKLSRQMVSICWFDMTVRQDGFWADRSEQMTPIMVQRFLLMVHILVCTRDAIATHRAWEANQSDCFATTFSCAVLMNGQHE
jgi:hypothetical protein